MRRPHSRAHVGVLSACVAGCIWVGLSDEKIAPEVLTVRPAPDVRAADTDWAPLPPAPPTPPAPQPLQRFLEPSSAPVASDLAP